MADQNKLKLVTMMNHNNNNISPTTNHWVFSEGSRQLPAQPVREFDHDVITQNQDKTEPNLSSQVEMQQDVINRQHEQDSMLAYDPLKVMSPNQIIPRENQVAEENGAKTLSSKISSEGPSGRFQHLQRKFKHFEFFWRSEKSKNAFHEKMGNTPSIIFLIFQNLDSFFESAAWTSCPLTSFFDFFCRENLRLSSSISNHALTFRI